MTGGDRARLLRAVCEGVLERALVGPELFVARAHRAEVFHHRVGHRLLERAVARPVERRLNGVGGGPSHRGHDLDQVGDAGLVRRADHLGPGVGHGRAKLLDDRIGLVQHVDRALWAGPGCRHLALRILQVHDPGAHLAVATLGHDERLAEAGVEALRDVAHQLDMLPLVVAHRHLRGPVGEHVGRHQHRVVEEPRADELPLRRRLLLELVHAVEVADRGHAGQKPAELRVLLDVALTEENAALGLESRGEQRRGGVVDGRSQQRGLVGNRRRVQVDDAVDRLAAVLARDVLGDCSYVVAEVLSPRGLDTRKDPNHELSEGSLGRLLGVLAFRRVITSWAGCRRAAISCARLGRWATADPRFGSRAIDLGRRRVLRPCGQAARRRSHRPALR